MVYIYNETMNRAGCIILQLFVDQKSVLYIGTFNSHRKIDVWDVYRGNLKSNFRETAMVHWIWVLFVIQVHLVEDTVHFTAVRKLW